MRRIARWSAAIAVALLTVLAAGLLAGGSAAAAEGPATAASGEHSHECHGAPLQDVEHGAAAPARPADDAPGVPALALAVRCVRTEPVTVTGPPVRPHETPPAPTHASTADLQVFRI